jgi:hypothetical protein
MSFALLEAAMMHAASAVTVVVHYAVGYARVR